MYKTRLCKLLSHFNSTHGHGSRSPARCALRQQGSALIQAACISSTPRLGSPLAMVVSAVTTVLANTISQLGLSTPRERVPKVEQLGQKVGTLTLKSHAILSSQKTTASNCISLSRVFHTRGVRGSLKSGPAPLARPTKTDSSSTMCRALSAPVTDIKHDSHHRACVFLML